MRKLVACIVMCIILTVANLSVFAQSSNDTMDDYIVSLKEEYAEDIINSLPEATLSSVKKAMSVGMITPSELTKYCLDRIEAYNATYNCFITMCDDALEKALEKDKLLKEGKGEGNLFGIPVVIKDNMNLEGYVTTNGRKGVSKIETTNADCVQRLLDEGAIIIGKTNMSTDSNNAKTSISAIKGETKNAYNPLLCSGGSSGGSSCAVSLNFAFAGIGSDTNSSLRLPAVLNGCVSLRTTFGLSSTEGVSILSPTRDTIGAITGDVKDQAIMLDVLTNNRHAYYDNLKNNSLQTLRVGVLKELSYPVRNSYARSAARIDKEIRATFDATVENLKSAGAEVIDVSFPEVFYYSDLTIDDNKNQSLKDEVYSKIEHILVENQIDVIIYPSYLNTPLRSGTDENGTVYDYRSQTFINNCQYLSPASCCPAIAITMGYHSLGAGIGLEIVSRKNNEQLLLNVANSYYELFSPRKSPLQELVDGPSIEELTKIFEKKLQEHDLQVSLENIGKGEIETYEPEENSDENSISKLAKEYIIPIVAIVFICVLIPMFGVIKNRKRK